MSERKKIIARTIRLNTNKMYRIWDNGDVELLYLDSWLLQNDGENFSLWKKNIRKLIPGKKYRFMNWGGILPFERCFREATPSNNSRVILEVYGFDPVKCPECGSENVKDSRCLDCGEWLRNKQEDRSFRALFDNKRTSV